MLSAEPLPCRGLLCHLRKCQQREHSPGEQDPQGSSLCQTQAQGREAGPCDPHGAWRPAAGDSSWNGFRVSVTQQGKRKETDSKHRSSEVTSQSRPGRALSSPFPEFQFRRGQGEFCHSSCAPYCWFPSGAILSHSLQKRDSMG